jgi:hypothetical protein
MFLAARQAAEASGPGNADARYGFATAMLRIVQDSRASRDAIDLAIQAVRDTLAAGTGDAVLDRQLADAALRWIPGAPTSAR